MQAIAEKHKVLQLKAKKLYHLIKLLVVPETPIESGHINCARDWIRTSTSFRTLPPQSSASTNFATRANNLEFGILCLE